MNNSSTEHFIVITNALNHFTTFSGTILHGKRPFCFQRPHPLGDRGLGKTYDVHLMLIGKRVVDFLLVLTELFC